MLDQLIHALVATKNEAADDLLLKALRLGTENEQARALSILVKRKTSRGLCGVVAQYRSLPESLQSSVLANIRLFHHALAECGRSNGNDQRLSAMHLIAIGRQGKLTYVLSENLHNPDPALCKGAAEAMVALARWVANGTRKLQLASGEGEAPAEPERFEDERSGSADFGELSRAGASPSKKSDPPLSDDRNVLYEQIMAERAEIENAVARAINVHRGKHGPDLLRAALLLADWPGSKTLAILHTTKHGGQSPMVRRLQQPPQSEHVPAFLLGATHGQLRSHFGSVFAHIDEAPVLDGLLRKTHWLKDRQLQLCLHQVTRGTWWGLSELRRDAARRDPADSAAIADWVAASGLHEVEQDERLQLLLEHAGANPGEDSPGSVAGRLHLLRVAMGRRRGTTVSLLKQLLTDPDERIARMAAREIIRRKPADFENVLLKLMTTVPDSVRTIIGRAIGQAGFDSFWQRFDQLEKSTRRQAGKAMLKLLPDGIGRLQRRAMAGPVDDRVKAMQIMQELGVAETVQETLMQLCDDANPRVRSKAVTVLGDVPAAPNNALIDRLLNDSDARVRANTVEVLEARQDAQFVPVLAQRAHAATGRERANAIKAMHRMKVSTAGSQLMNMLRDDRPEHRISALWALRQIGWWQLLNEVGKLAKDDQNLRVRRYALGVLKTVADLLRDQSKAAG